MNKPEHKRYREKKRRGEVKTGFDALKDIMLTIDPNVQDFERLYRVELISRAVKVMRDLFQENEALKRRLNQNKVPVDASQRSNIVDTALERQNDLVTVAVPYLVPTEQMALEFPMSESTYENRYHATYYGSPYTYPSLCLSQNYHNSHPLQTVAPSPQSQSLSGNEMYQNQFTQEQHYFPPSQPHHQYSNLQHDYHPRQEDSRVQPVYPDHYPPPHQDYRIRY